MTAGRNISEEEERLIYRVRSRVEMARDALARFTRAVLYVGQSVPRDVARPRLCIPRREDDDDAILEDVLDALPILLSAYARDRKRAAAEPEATLSLPKPMAFRDGCLNCVGWVAADGPCSCPCHDPVTP